MHESTKARKSSKNTSPNPSKRGEHTTPNFFEGEKAPSLLERAGGEVKIPQKSDTLPFQYGDTLVLQGFISDEDAFQYKKTHEITLTEDTLVTFAFFNELAYIDTVEITLIEFSDGFRGISPCYYPVEAEDIWRNNELANFLLITTQSQLDSLFACADTLTPPDVDFEKQTLLLAKGGLPYFPGAISHFSFSLSQLCDGNFILQAGTFLGGGEMLGVASWMISTNRALSKEQISVIIKYK